MGKHADAEVDVGADEPATPVELDGAVELVIGAGNNRRKMIRVSDEEDQFSSPVYLDIDDRCDPDVLWDLNDRPLPFDDEQFSEIHAYEVLEHVGRQGDWRGFFEEFDEYYRILKPGGHIFGTVPSLQSNWLWGDPGHTRVISPEVLVFLDRKEYERQVGDTAMTDYRTFFRADFVRMWEKDDGKTYWFVLEKRDEKA